MAAALILYIIFCIAAFLLFAFVVWDINPRNWIWLVRIFYAIVVVVFGVSLNSVTMERIEKLNKENP